MRLDNVELAGEREVPAPDEKSARTAVLVLGMHRSGTGALTRVLNLLGCDLPDGATAPEDGGPAGASDQGPVVALNDRILASAGSSWDDWTGFNERWFRSPKADECRAQARRLLTEDLGRSYFFALSDPRICRFPAFWIEAVEAAGARPVAVLPVRNPLEVAASLEERDGFEPRLGQLIWLRHVLDAEHGTRGLPRSFTSYDGLLDGWNAVARKAEDELDIVWPRLSDSAAAEIEAYLDRGSRHHAEPEARVAEDLTLPDWVRRAHEIFARWARSGEDQKDRKALDAIRAELDAAAPAFGRLLASGRRAAGQVRALEQSLDEASAQVEVVNAEAAERARMLERSLEEARAQLETASAEAAEQVRALERSLEEATAKLEAEAARSIERDAEVRQLNAEREAEAARWAERDAEARRLKAELDAEVRQLKAELDRKTQAEEKIEARLEAATAELAEASRARKEAEASREAERKYSDAALDTARRESAGRLEELHRLKDEIAAVREESEDALAEARARLSEAEGRLAETESALRQRSHESEQTAAELARAEAARAEAEGLATSYREHVALLLEDGRRQAREVVELRRQQAEAAELVGRTLVALAFGRRWPRLRRLQARLAARRLRRSGVVDAEWYRAQNDDVAEAGLDPVLHYLMHGAEEGRAPNPALAQDPRRKAASGSG